MIKKSFRLMLLVAFALSSVMFVACNKYDDDIERIDSEIAALNATVQSLKAAVDGGAVISSVSNTAEGVKFTLSNGQSYVVNHGTAGKDGAAGKNGSIVEIGENGNWVIDGTDTGVSAKGQSGKAPQINASGNWEIWDATAQAWVDTKISAVGASTYVVDKGSYYELNVMEQIDGQNAGYKTINLPKTASIASLQAVSIEDGKIGEAVVTLNYGEKLASKRIFNGNTYAAGTNLIAAGSSLSAIVNPISVDASLYEFSLMDSKDNAPYVITKVSANRTESALTKSDSPNRGVWDMSVSFSSDLLFSDQYNLYDYAAARSEAAYALVAKTANGNIASAYDVTVTEKEIALGDLSSFAAANLEGNVNEAIDLSETFGNTMPYVVDYYFALADKAAAATVGATLNGNTLVATKAGVVKVKVYYLLVDGTCKDGNRYASADVITVTVNHVAENATLQDVEWTINNGPYASNHYVSVNISGIKSMITPNSDSDIVYVKLAGWTWADGTDLDDKTVVVNKVKYGEAGDATHKFAGNESTWIASVVDGKTNRYASGTAASNFSRSNYVKFNFNYANAFPGEYTATLEFRLNSNSGDALVTAPVKVIIKAPEVTPFQRLDAYFDGDNAVAYGEAANGAVTYNLFELYEEMSATEMANVTFDEDNYDANYYVTTDPWLVANGNNGDISVGTNRYNYGDYNLDDVYTTREMYAKYVVFGNEHIPYVTDTFNLTIKSEIAEGKLDATAAAITITDAVNAVPVSLKNVVATDVYGKVYNLGNVYGQDDDGNWTVSKGAKDARLASVTFFTEDTQFITVDETLANANDGYSAFTVKRAGNTVLTKDQECTVYVRVTDNWGRRTTSSFKVLLKK